MFSLVPRHPGPPPEVRYLDPKNRGIWMSRELVVASPPVSYRNPANMCVVTCSSLGPCDVTIADFKWSIHPKHLGVL